MGVYRVEDVFCLEEALRQAFSYENQALIERCIIGREFSVAVVEGRALPIIEIAPLVGFYDYKNKYQAGSTIETCPADLPANLTASMPRKHARLWASKAMPAWILCWMSVPAKIMHWRSTPFPA